MAPTPQVTETIGCCFRKREVSGVLVEQSCWLAAEELGQTFQ